MSSKTISQSNFYFGENKQHFFKCFQEGEKGELEIKSSDIMIIEVVSYNKIIIRSKYHNS